MKSLLNRFSFFTAFVFLAPFFWGQVDQPNTSDSVHFFNKVRLSAHFGLNHTMDSQMLPFFHTQSFFSYGFDVRFERKKSTKLCPFLSYDRVNFNTDSYTFNDKLYASNNSTSTQKIMIDTVLKINQVCIGLEVPFYQTKSNSVYSILGYNLGEFRISETQHNILYSGLRLGFGLEHLIMDKHLFSHSLEFIYDLNKPFFTYRSENQLNYNTLKIRYVIGIKSPIGPNIKAVSDWWNADL